MRLRFHGFVWSTKTNRRSARALTLPEFLLVLGGMGVALVIVAGAIRHVRDDAKVAQTHRFLSRLDRALSVYHKAHASYPAGGLDAGSADCLAALKADPSAWSVLDGLSPRLIARPAGKPRYFQDGWGTPLRYITAAGSSSMQDRVAVHDGRPIFESAGPDRDFGHRDLAGLTDNLATDYLTLE